jgi:hypothetical protein
MQLSTGVTPEARCSAGQSQATHMTRAAHILYFAALPTLLLGIFAFGAPHETYAWDFHAFWQGAADVAHGRDPFAAPGVSPSGLHYAAYLYPPVLADMLLPLGLLPFLVAAMLFIVLSAAAIAVALWLLGVRDWRCYGVAFLWFPVLHGLRLGALTPMLVLGVACCWRFRSSARMSVPLALVTVVKLFLWPLIVWRAARSSLRSAAGTVAVAVLIVVGSWATIGFAHFADYPQLLRDTQGTWMANGYTLAALGSVLHLPDGVTAMLLLAGAAIASAAIARALRRGRIDERESLALFVWTACLFSPVGWLHYSALLLIPVALLTPKLSPAWLVPVAFWFTPFEESGGESWRIALGLSLSTATVALALSEYRSFAVRQTAAGVGGAVRLGP